VHPRVAARRSARFPGQGGPDGTGGRWQAPSRDRLSGADRRALRIMEASGAADVQDDVSGRLPTARRPP